MKLWSDALKNGALIDERFAFGRADTDGSTVRSENLNPPLCWDGAPEGTRSFMLACLDDDVPTNLNERDRSGELPATQPRRRFVHWVQIDCPAGVTTLPEGVLADKLVDGWGRCGINDYSRGQPVELGEIGTGYDGPCPPAFDARWHGYRFMVLALDVPALKLPALFTFDEALKAAGPHILATAELVGLYSLNPRLIG